MPDNPRVFIDTYFARILAGQQAGCIVIDGPAGIGGLDLARQRGSDFASKHGNAQVLVLPRAGLDPDPILGAELLTALMRSLCEPTFHLVVIFDEAHLAPRHKLLGAMQALRATSRNLTVVVVGQDLDFLDPENTS
jgi:hypothetical protein